MIQKRFLVALGTISTALAACSADISSPTQAEATSGGSGNSPGGGSGAVSNQGGAGGSTVGLTCVAGVPTSSQIPRLLNRQYDAVVRDLLGVTTLDDGKPPSASLYNDFDGPMNKDAWSFYQNVGAKVAAAAMAGAGKSMFMTCDPAAADCLKTTIETFGRKAFRRPLTAAESTSIQRLINTTPAGTPAQVAEAILYTFLVSPSFLQITELTDTPAAGGFKLSQFEVAARLSFMLWGSVPDDILNTAADNNQLATKDQILTQAKRMIAVREKTAPLVAGFHRKYLEMDNADSHWWKVDHDKTKYPLYPGEAVKDTYAAELDAFFEEVAFNNGAFKDLFLSNVAYVNNQTAPIYGLDPAAYGTELKRVELDKTQRPGFLTRLGFLSSYSHFASSSPILRGAFITVNIIGVNPGAPDPNFFLTPPPEGEFATERAYVDALTSAAACKGCHIPMVNPPGFVLENFDSIGKWQTVDPRANGDAVAGKIDASADVTLAPGNVKTIHGPLELMQALATVPAAKHIYAEKWVSFATGRLPNQEDACTVNLIDTKLAEDGYTVLNLLADLTQADSFSLRAKGN